MSDAVAVLKDLITSASVSLSPSVAWAAFASSWHAKQVERRMALRARLFEVREELDHIAHWAKTEYPEDAHGQGWRDPLWAVNDFPTQKVEEFNRIMDPAVIGKSVSEALIKLEASIARFRILLGEQQTFVWKGGGQALLTPAHGLAPETNDPTFPFRVSTAWLNRLYELNKSIHVKGIGTGDDPGGLHSTWRTSTSEINRLISRIGKSSQPWIMKAGHLLAAVLGFVGVGFLISFIVFFLHSVSWPSAR